MLAFAAAPLFVAFAWQHTVASVGDDSVSYLAIASWFAGGADPLLAPWLAWHSHFPPFFPMVLAATGGAGDFLVAHVVVAVCAAVSLGLVARYAGLRLQDDWSGLAVACGFLVLPTAWISVKGILSESLYLAVSLAALLAHERWIARGDPRARSYLAFGVLLALAHSTRAVGITLVAAFAVHEAVRAVSTREIRARALWALVPVAAFAIAWTLARPGGHVYASTVSAIATSWLDAPMRALQVTSAMFLGGWTASFVAEGDVAPAIRVVVYAVGIAALAGSTRAALRNRIDGWYVLLTALVVFLWLGEVDNMRRLLYPVVPLALMHAAEAVIALVRRARVRKPRMAVMALCAAPLALCLPATALVAEKSFDRAALVPGSRYRACDITDYYQLINRPQALALAAKHAGTLAGLEALRTATAPQARVMWMRPEYVALLGGRAGVPYEYGWDARTLATRIRDERVDYLVIAGISKSDVELRLGDPIVAMRQAQPYSERAMALSSPYTGEDEFVLLRIDRAALEAWLAAAPR
ncbi:MAG TPA: hypothetical protein VM051_02290 [Usitatibacter sp.]|nr:hypothetical protein [Usitatibacter sp.]